MKLTTTTQVSVDGVMQGEVAGLLALMVLSEARHTAGFRRAVNWSPSASRTAGPGTRR